MAAPSLKPTRFALCIETGAYPTSLQTRKLYEVRPDAEAERHGQLDVDLSAASTASGASA